MCYLHFEMHYFHFKICYRGTKMHVLHFEKGLLRKLRKVKYVKVRSYATVAARSRGCRRSETFVP